MLLESLKYDCVNSFLQELLTQDRYKKITPSNAVDDNYFITSKYAFYLGVDALVKFEIIIDDMSYINEYVEQLSRIFKKITNSSDIRYGVYNLIAKIISVKLSLNNTNSLISRERILYYIYNKYIVNGYFYFGFSSYYYNEVSCIGIRHDGFGYDEKLENINQVMKKYCNKELFPKQSVSITDNIIIALFYALLSPNYLTSMATNQVFSSKKYDKECFYTKDIVKIKDMLLQVLNEYRINNEDKKNIINSFVDTYVESTQNNTHPCIARIKRSAINKDKLRDIEEIVKSYDESIATCIELIVDSRYEYFDLTSDISCDDIEIISVPTYNDFIIGKNSFMFSPVIKASKEELEVDDSMVTNNVTVNSYGAVSIAIIGVLLIIIGTVITIVLRLMG